MLLAAAMQKAGSADPAGYLPELKRLKHAGVTADIEFDANGDLETRRAFDLPRAERQVGVTVGSGRRYDSISSPATRWRRS